MIDEATVARYAPLAEQVRRCEASAAPLWIRGGGTLLVEPAAGVSAIELRHFRDLVAHARADLTVTAQAGMTVAQLSALLDAAGQQLPLDVPFADRTTIGGLIATNLSGPRRFSRGGVRDLLLGVTIVGRGGEIFRGGGRVVKNVAGYDLCKLYTGSWGWLGAIVEATFRVVPRPEASAALAVRLSDPHAAESLIAGLLTGSLRPASIDLLNPAVADRLGLSVGRLTMVVGLEGLREEVESQLQAAGTAALWPADEAIALSGAQYGAYCRVAVETALVADCAARFSVPSSAVAEFVGDFAERCPRVPLVAHAADGVIWCGFSASDTESLKFVCAKVAAQGGSWLLPRGPHRSCSDLPMLSPPREDWALMRRVKAALDPVNIFGRGGPFDLALRPRDA